MKTLNNNLNQIFKTISMLAIALLITFGTAFAHGSDSTTTDEEASSEKVALLDEILDEMEQDEAIVSLLNNRVVKYEIYDDNNNLVFKGTEKQWNNIEDEELVTMKRKAEFLLRTTTSKVYKVF